MGQIEYLPHSRYTVRQPKVELTVHITLYCGSGCIMLWGTLCCTLVVGLMWATDMFLCAMPWETPSSPHKHSPTKTDAAQCFLLADQG